MLTWVNLSLTLFRINDAHPPKISTEYPKANYIYPITKLSQSKDKDMERKIIPHNDHINAKPDLSLCKSNGKCPVQRKVG